MSSEQKYGHPEDACTLKIFLFMFRKTDVCDHVNSKNVSKTSLFTGRS